MKYYQQTTINRLTLNTFLWIAAIIGILLMIAAIVMQLAAQLNWKVGDFLVMSGLLFICCSFCYIQWHQLGPRLRLTALIALILMLLNIGAELAEGVFIGVGA